MDVVVVADLLFLKSDFHRPTCGFVLIDNLLNIPRGRCSISCVVNIVARSARTGYNATVKSHIWEDTSTGIDPLLQV